MAGMCVCTSESVQMKLKRDRRTQHDNQLPHAWAADAAAAALIEFSFLRTWSAVAHRMNRFALSQCILLCKKCKKKAKIVRFCLERQRRRRQCAIVDMHGIVYAIQHAYVRYTHICFVSLEIWVAPTQNSNLDALAIRSPESVVCTTRVCSPIQSTNTERHIST